MKSKLHLGRGVAILACTAAAALVLAPVSPAAAATKCGNKVVKVPVEGGKPVNYPVKAIEVEGGTTCAEAASVIGPVLAGQPPAGWKSVTPHFELPKALADQGLFPQEVKKGSKKIKFAIRGG
jgi:hypothetical protein